MSPDNFNLNMIKIWFRACHIQNTNIFTFFNGTAFILLYRKMIFWCTLYIVTNPDLLFLYFNFSEGALTPYPSYWPMRIIHRQTNTYSLVFCAWKNYSLWFRVNNNSHFRCAREGRLFTNIPAFRGYPTPTAPLHRSGEAWNCAVAAGCWELNLKIYLLAGLVSLIHYFS